MTLLSRSQQAQMVAEAEAANRKLLFATAALDIHTATSTVHTAIDSKILDNLLTPVKGR